MIQARKHLHAIASKKRRMSAHGDDAAASGASSEMRFWPVALLLAAAVAVSGVAFDFVLRGDQHRLEEVAFEQRASTQVAAIQRGIDRNLELLVSIEGLFSVADQIDRDDFRVFVNTSLSRRPDIQALEWIPRVSGADRTSFEDTAQAVGFADFQITERQAGGLIGVRSQHSEYYPAYFVAPVKGNEAAMGFDFASDPVMLEALEAARDTGEPVATARITLAPDAGQQPGFAIFHPVYREAGRGDSVSERIEKLEGFAVGVFRIDDMASAALQGTEAHDIDLYIFDESAPQGQRFLYLRSRDDKQTVDDSSIEQQRGMLSAGPYHSAMLDVGGRKWLVMSKPGPDYVSVGGGWDHWGVLSAGLALTGLLAAFAAFRIRAEQELRRTTVSRDLLSEEVAQRRSAEEKLQTAQDRLSGILDTAEDAIVSIDESNRITLFNIGATKIFGYQPDEVMGRPLDLLLPTRFQRDDDKHVQRFAASPIVAREIEDLAGASIHGRHKNGKEFPIEATVSQLDLGSESVLTAILRDVTERERLEQRLAERVEDLGRSNAELEQFAYVASHDLQAPLRSVVGFSTMLAEDYVGQLDNDADELISHTVNAALRMQQLIDDLLAYSRVGRKTIRDERTDCEALLEQELEDLSVTIRETKTIVTHDPLPVVVGDATLIGQVFRNLINNAMLYRNGKSPTVHVGVRKSEQEWIFSLQDNGIGIDPQYVERIFVIFQRLHSNEEYSGTGIGLAICRKAVAHLGGRIWVHSQLGEGATFYFTVPIAIDDALTHGL
ncbi:MAG: CHASE domain-containing protein [SAR202 cluster bacterium]|nr:CHASE domain-containing protein [SAR202 cluster bacterium]MDP6664796.1 CHASE domain-containing protein [SAR202 cluster bacterium]MDP6799290.1 CHASE domain-containing protein [SAR202 cluster bacterium]